MHNIPPQTILSAMNAAVEAAQSEGVDIAVSIVDASGHPISSIAMPNAFLASVDYAYQKAWTAVSFKLPTQDFDGLLDKFGDSIRTGLLAHEKVTALPGGVPIIKDGTLIGGIGISGGDGAQDESWAATTLAAITG